MEHILFGFQFEVIDVHSEFNVARNVRDNFINDDSDKQKDMFEKYKH